jgi:2-polyprenyl-6-methoxyphenol hydroxylase-like FAD-dependent oxidoreductase
VGAGPCGLTTALALRHHGFEDVTVYDKFPEIKPALGAAFNLNGGASVLDKLGVLATFREHNNPMRVVRTRRVGNDLLGQTELMNIEIDSLIRERRERARFANLLNGRRRDVRHGDAVRSSARAG